MPTKSSGSARSKRNRGSALPLRTEGVRITDALAKASLIPPKRIPVSYAQQRVWFMQQLMPGSALFHLHTAVRIRNPLSESVLEGALNEIVRRHGSLRTTFSPDEEYQVSQLVAPSLRLRLPVTDLTGLPRAQREGEAFRIATEEAREPFDLERGPLLRARLLRLGPLDHFFLFTMHHIISDGWSMGIFWKELGVVWEAFATGKASPIPKLNVQYVDYCLCQRQQLTNEHLANQLAYWRRQLAEIPTLDLPFAKPRPAVQTFNGARYRFNLSTGLLGKLQELCRQESVTLFMVLLSAFAVLLARCCEQTDLVLGTYIAGRDHTEFEQLIGFFLNTLVLRINASGNPLFTEVLQRVRNVTIDAYSNQEVPFAKLVEELQPKRDLTRNPLFQVLFQLLNVPTLKDVTRGPRPEVIEVERGTSAFDISCTLQETGTGLTGELEYNTDLFEATDITKFALKFVRVLESVVRCPTQQLSELTMLTPTERYRVVNKWNRTESDRHQGRSIVSMFEARARRHAARIALLYDGSRLRYGELDRRANQLAHYLRDAGVGPEVIVGICLERSPECVIALLAVLKARGAFLPLDPSYPADRLRLMIENSQAKLILTSTHLQASLPGNLARLVCIDQERENIARCSVERLGETVPASELAYVIYTSGSTGSPKGVAVEHRQILNRLQWMWSRYPFEPGEVGCQKTPLSFVDSIWEIFGPLLQGIPTLMIPDAVVHDPQALINILAEHCVTRIWLVPSLLRALLTISSRLGHQLPYLRFWVASGEDLPAELLDRFQSAAPNATLFNLYGTSEVWDATWFDTNAHDHGSLKIPIGQPISNVQTYVLDSFLEPVAVGSSGELYVGGEGLARCYLHNAQQTAERFIPNPFGTQLGARLYRTGDLARWLPDGNLELLGRTDRQVKLRGYRIELNEIESALKTHKSVEQAAVTVRESADAGPLLTAYVVPTDSAFVNEAELRNFVGSSLPRYMVPSRIVSMKSLPLTPSGKLDRLKLPALLSSEPSPARVNSVAVTPTEETVHAIWSQVLERNDFGTHENFFDAGGHSLLMVRVFNLLRNKLDNRITITDLFEYPTVSSIAAFLDHVQSPAASFVKVRDRALKQRKLVMSGHVR